VGVFTYALTQAWAIVHYLVLVVWPAGLTFDYGMPVVENPAEVAVPIVLLLISIVLTLRALWRRQPAGVAGAAFFLLLAPSSSIVPIATQTIAEHRLYLALAALIVLICAAAARGIGRLGLLPIAAPLLVSLAAGGLAFLTFARNADYASVRSLWADTVAQRPDNPRAHHNLGLALLADGRKDEAVRQFREAIRLQPTHAFAHFQLGALAMTGGALSEAAEHFDAALQADRHYVDARVNLGHVLAREGRVDEAIAHYRVALAEAPAADIRVSLAALLMQRGRLDEAAPLLQQALAEAPQLPETHYQWARLRERAGDLSAAEAELRTALRLRPDFGAAALALGNLLGRQGRFADAIENFRVALAAEPTSHQARNNLANCFLALGRFPEAIAEYERILQARPTDAAVRKNLEIARAMQAQR
jgi:tetratricopeptide (TPR) repeat protein